MWSSITITSRAGPTPEGQRERQKGNFTWKERDCPDHKRQAKRYKATGVIEIQVSSEKESLKCEAQQKVSKAQFEQARPQNFG